MGDLGLKQTFEHVRVGIATFFGERITIYQACRLPTTASYGDAFPRPILSSLWDQH